MGQSIAVDNILQQKVYKQIRFCCAIYHEIKWMHLCLLSLSMKRDFVRVSTCYLCRRMVSSLSAVHLTENSIQHIVFRKVPKLERTP